MRVLKTFVILDIVLYITGVTSFKCISVLLTKFLVGLEYIPSFTLTWNSSPAPVLCPPIRPRPPPPPGSWSATRACPWLQESPSTQWEAFSMWYVNQFFPFSMKKGQTEKQRRRQEDAECCQVRWARSRTRSQSWFGWGGQPFSLLGLLQAMLM